MAIDNDIKEYIKNNLKIRVTTDWYDNEIIVDLLLENEIISTSKDIVQVRREGEDS